MIHITFELNHNVSAMIFAEQINKGFETAIARHFYANTREPVSSITYLCLG